MSAKTPNVMSLRDVVGPLLRLYKCEVNIRFRTLHFSCGFEISFEDCWCGELARRLSCLVTVRCWRSSIFLIGFLVFLLLHCFVCIALRSDPCFLS